MKIALDGMGGDYAPENVILGLKAALEELPDCPNIALVGQPERLEPLLKEHGISEDSRVELAPASEVVEMEDSATICLRQKKDSSITVASKMMKEGSVQAIVSAGHTGAAVTATKVQNRTLPGVDRPGIVSFFPSKKGFFIMLDVGANPDSKAIHLAQYAIMGQVYSRLILGVENPTIGILSVGEEEHKGNELTKETMQLMKRMDIPGFLGNIEGKDMFSGDVDVVVCDGFVGNIVLKCSEALAKTIGSILEDNIRKTPIRKAGYVLSKSAFKELKEITDYDEYGGAPLLGINGYCIIGHGSSTPKAIKNAIRVAADMARKEVNNRIQQRVAEIDWKALLEESEE